MVACTRGSALCRGEGGEGRRGMEGVGGGMSAATGGVRGEGVVWRGEDGSAAFTGGGGRVGEAFAAGVREWRRW